MLLCPYLEADSVRLFNNFFRSDLTIIIFSIKHNHIFLSHIYTGMHKLGRSTVNSNHRFLLSVSISVLITPSRLQASCV